MNTKTKYNLKRTLSVFLTLLMVLSAVSVGIVVPAAAEGEGAELIGRYFSTSNKWEDTQGGGSGLGWAIGDYPSDQQADGFYKINSFLKMDHTSIFENVSADTGLTIAYTYRPGQNSNHHHLFSFGNRNADKDNINADSIKNHLYISATPSWFAGSSMAIIGFVDGNGIERIKATPNGAPAFEAGKTYDVVVRITTSGITYWINGVEYSAACEDDSATYLTQFLNEVHTYTYNYIGRSRWNTGNKWGDNNNDSDADYYGYVKDLRIYKGALSLTETQEDFNVAAYDANTPSASDFSAPSFNAVAYHYNDEATGGYSNLVYASGQNTTLLTGNDNWVEIKGTNFKAFTPSTVVMVRDGVNSTFFPVQVETKRRSSSVWYNHIRYIASNQESDFGLIQDWIQTLDGNYSNAWTRWAGTNSNFGPEYIPHLKTGDSGKDDQNDTSRFAWNALEFIKNNESTYYDAYNYVEFEAKAYCTWTGASDSNKTAIGTFRTNEGSAFYAINYAPIYAALPSALSCYNELTAHEGWYTEESVARAKATLYQIVAANPNNSEYTYAADANAAVQNCAINIKKAVTLLGSTGGTYGYEGLNLVKKTGTVYWVNEGTTVETDTGVEYGETPTYNDATPTKQADKQYTYSFNAWSPAIGIVNAPETTYTATFNSTPQTYSASVTGERISNTASAAATATFGTDYTFTPAVETFYHITGVRVVVDGKELEAGDYTVEDYAVTIPGEKITGNVAITYTTAANTFGVTVNGSNLAAHTYADATLYTTYTTELFAAEHYHITGVSSVKVGSTTHNSGFTYTDSAKTVTVPGTWITNSIVINATTAPDTFNLTYSGNVTNGGATVTYGVDYTATLEPSTGSYLTGDEISVTVGGTELVKGTDFTYSNGTLKIWGQNITGDVVITAITGNTYPVTFSENLSNAAATATYGEEYSVTLTPSAEGAYVTGATVTIGGTEVSNVYNNGTVTIPGTAITGAINITATTDNKYTITFVDEDGTTVLDTKTLAYGAAVTYGGTTPTKASTAQYDYTFGGWSDGTTNYAAGVALPAVAGNTTYTAYYTPTTRSYTITWVDGDGKTIETDTSVEYGATPTYNGTTPTKTATAQYTYSFNNTWSPAITTVSGDATYTAQFNSTVNKYSVTFVDEDDTVLLAATQYDYGTALANITKPADPEKTDTAEFDYEFTGWTPALAEVTQDVTYKATYSETKRSYTITWNDDENNLIDTTTVEYGVTPTHADASKADDNKYSYTFTGWDPALASVTGPATYAATFSKTPKTYTVTVKGENHITAATYSDVPYGTYYDVTLAAETHYHIHAVNSVTVGGAALTEGEDYSYTNGVVTIFGTAITGNVEITATAEENAYTITWVLHDSSVETDAAPNEVPSYDAPSYTGTNNHVYKFKAWTPEPVAATGNATYTATYEIDKDAAANVHTFGEATYTPTEADGVITKVTASKTCSVCDYVLTEDATLTSTTTPATCSAKGTTTYTAKFSDAFETQTYTRDNIAINENAHDYNVANATFAWVEDGNGGWKYVATIPCALNNAHPAKTVEANVTVSTADADCVTANDTTYTATGFAADTGLTLPAGYEDKVIPGSVDANAHAYDNANASFAWVKPDGGDWEYVATILCANDPNHEAKVVRATVTTESTGANCTTPGNTTYIATGFPTESGLSLPATYENKVITGETNNEHDYDYTAPIITPPTKTGDTWSDGSVVYACKRNEAHQTAPVAVARADYSAYDAEILKVQTFLAANDLNSTVKSALQAILDTALAQDLVTMKDGVDYNDHTAFDQQGTVDAAVASMRTALADVLNTYATPDGEGGYTFNENALATYSAVFTDNLGGTNTVEKPAGTVWSVAKDGYKLLSITANHGETDLANATYTFKKITEADAVTLTYAVDVDAALAAARTILNNSENYDNNDNFLDRLQQAYDDLLAIQNNPEKNTEAAALKQTVLDLVDESRDHKKDGSLAIVTFIYGKNDDVPFMLETTVGAAVSAPSNTSYVSAGFTYPVAYWTDAENNKYTTTFPVAVDGATYHAVYTLYDLKEALDAIRAAKAKEDVIGTTSIAELESLLSQIDTLFENNGVSVSEYRTVQANTVNKETEEGQTFIETLWSLIGQMQSVANSAEVVCEGHVFDYYDQKVATCTEDGYTAYRICRLCGTKVGGDPIPATGHSANYDRDPVRSGALGDGTCVWDTYTCNHGCGDFYVIPTYIARYTDSTPIAGATVTLFADGHNISVITDVNGRAPFRGLIAPGELKEGEYALTVSLGETAKTGVMKIHNGRVTMVIEQLERSGGSGDDGEGGGSSGSFRCPMCGAYEELRTMPVVGWFVAIVHFFVHMAYRIINASTSFSGKFSF
ncbi:MAG: hypothetical protein IJU56_09865 [Clostridia bacterium]|nr:hypothetical protein [Clostridia bacterium]